MFISEYSTGDEIKVLSLFKEVFHKEMPMDYWQWRFMQNPIRKTFIKLMWHDDKLVGHYAVCPVYLLVDGEQTLTGLSMTTMTHPDYNGKGIFSKLANSLYADAVKLNTLNAVWGFPNINSHAGFIKNLGWTDLPVIPNFSLPITEQRYLKSTNSQFGITQSFTQKHELAYKLLSQNFAVNVLKDSSYLNWRYINNPTNNYTIFEFDDQSLAYFAITKMYENNLNQKEIDIVEFVVPDDYGIILDFLAFVLNYYQPSKIRKVNLWLPLYDKRHLILEKLGFQNSLPITYMGLRCFNAKQENKLLNCKNWFFSMGDSDVY